MALLCVEELRRTNLPVPRPAAGSPRAKRIKMQDDPHGTMTLGSAATEAAERRSIAVRSKAGRAAGSPPSTFIVLFALSLVSGMINGALWPTAGIGPGPGSLNLARSLAAHGTFADPYPTHPTRFSSHMAP